MRKEDQEVAYSLLGVKNIQGYIEQLGGNLEMEFRGH